MTADQLPRYDPGAPWKHLRSSALTREQARRIRHTLALTNGYTQGERDMLARTCADLGAEHFLVADEDCTIAVWRINHKPIKPWQL